MCYNEPMMRDLTDNEIEEFLRRGCYAHLACCEHVKYPYVIPITYVYRNKAFYCFSFTGRKIDIMREHRSVAVQVEELHDGDAWQSVIAWGEYEELHGEEQKSALDMILEKLWKESVEKHPLFFPFRSTVEALQNAKEGKGVILYRIGIDKWSGRLERYPA